MAIKNTICIQNILIPNKTFGSTPSKYMGSFLTSYSRDEVIIFSGGFISFDTYYNAFSMPVWKEQCGLDYVEFRATGTGKANVKLFIATIETDYELACKTLELDDSEQVIFSCNLSKIEKSGLLYITVSPFEDTVVFKKGGWYTDEKPKRDVVLGISVTHFNRKNYVLPAIERVKKNILDNPFFSDKIYFTIVDNSKNITKDEANGVNIIPNENTGGSGGFMRGLIHYENNTNATHVLFMDDDASCETDSILRTYWILSYAIKDNSVVSGSLFMDNRPDFLIEKGAKFDVMCKPNCHNCNVIDRHSLLKSELGYNPEANYGAWWFFAFPIKCINNYTFPFFVRGDDIFFGISNNFQYISPIGIACYGEDFVTKCSPMTAYLDTRSNIINSIYLKKNIKKVIKMYKLYYSDALYSHKYETVLAIRLALHHVLGNIDFWYNNYDLKAVREKINSFVKVEKFHNVNMDSINPNFMYKHRKKWVKKFTFNGLLLPLKKGIAYQNFNYSANYDHIYRYKNIFYYKSNNKTGYIVKVSRYKFFKLLFCLYIDTLTLRWNYKANVEKYRKNFDKLTSREFWEKILKI